MGIAIGSVTHVQPSNVVGSPQSVTIPGGSTVAVIAATQSSGTFSGPGTCVDSNSVTYTNAATYSNDSYTVQVDTFYIINSAAATSITYTLPAGATWAALGLSIWVLTPAGGTITYAAAAATANLSTTTGANAVTTGNLNVSTLGGIILGASSGISGGTLSAGTSMTLDVNVNTGQTIMEHALVSTATPCTWTESTAGEVVTIGGIGFDFHPLTVLLIPQATSTLGSGSASSQSATFASATTHGSTIFVVTMNNSGNTVTPTGFSEPVNGSYTQIDTQYDATGLIYYASYYFPNAQSISSATNLTLALSGAASKLGFVAFEVKGASATPLVAHGVNLQTNVTSVTPNLLTSPTVAGGSNTAVAVAVCSGYGIDQGPPTVGTGFTACPSPGNTFWNYSGVNIAAAEYQVYASPGSIAATFTAGGTSSDDYTTFIAVFNAGNSATVAWLT